MSNEPHICFGAPGITDNVVASRIRLEQALTGALPEGYRTGKSVAMAIDELIMALIFNLRK